MTAFHNTGRTKVKQEPKQYVSRLKPNKKNKTIEENLTAMLVISRIPFRKIKYETRRQGGGQSVAPGGKRGWQNAVKAAQFSGKQWFQ
jgi:hypothetical protein